MRRASGGRFALVTDTSGPSVGVVGSGYVGTVLASCLANLGRDVTVLEKDADKLADLSAGRVPFYEPSLEELLQAGMASGCLRFTDSVAEMLERSQVIFVCVGSPLGPNGHADMSYVKAAAREIGANLVTPHVLVTKSTVPIGSGQWLFSVVEDSYCGDTPLQSMLSVVSCPEFLREGSAVEDFLHPTRIVFGSDSVTAIDTAMEVYRPILDQSFAGGETRSRPAAIRTDLATAEMVKYAANAFLATKISFINEIANICELVDADVLQVSQAIGLDPRIGDSFLQAGLGWGGSCLGKDLSELAATAADYGYDPLILGAVEAVNRHQRSIIGDRLRLRLKTLQGRRICLLGLAFKPGTDDVRDSPGPEIAESLLAAGMSVSAHDPLVRQLSVQTEVRIEADAYVAATDADAVVLVTDWPEYRELDFDRIRTVMRGNLVIDGRNFLSRTRVTAAGLRYEGIGRPDTTNDSPDRFDEFAAAQIDSTDFASTEKYTVAMLAPAVGSHA